MGQRRKAPTTVAVHDVRAYRGALVAGDMRAADALLDRLLDEGARLPTLCDELIVPALWDIFDSGAGTGPASVVRREVALAHAGAQLQRLRHTRRPQRTLGCRALVVPVGAHGRLLGEVASAALSVEGWQTIWPGESLTPEQVEAVAVDEELELIVLSVDRPSQLASLRACAATLAAAGTLVPVLAFGPPQLRGWVADDAPPVGAVCESARELVTIAGGFVSERLSQPSLEQFLASLGGRVQVERRRRGWSQAQLASQAGLDRTYVSAVERGRQNLTVGAVLKLAVALRVPLRQLLVGD